MVEFVDLTTPEQRARNAEHARILARSLERAREVADEEEGRSTDAKE